MRGEISLARRLSVQRCTFASMMPSLPDPDFESIPPRKTKLTTFKATALVPFFVGQTVRLKSGGPLMCVMSVQSMPHQKAVVDRHGRPPGHDHAIVVCMWFSLGASSQAWTGPHTHEFVSTLLEAP